jgi:heme-degrading monooxygenase HmoA
VAKLVEADEHVTLARQMEEVDINGPVILFNRFTVNPEDVDGFLKAWTDDATIMKQQPGFISTQLHRGIAGSTTFINHAVWESVAAYRNAVNKVGVRSRLSNYPDSTIVSPHLFKKVAVPGISEG